MFINTRTYVWSAARSLSEKPFSVLSVVHHFLSNSTRRHGGHGAYTEKSDFPERLYSAILFAQARPAFEICGPLRSPAQPPCCPVYVACERSSSHSRLLR